MSTSSSSSFATVHQHLDSAVRTLTTTKDMVETFSSQLLTKAVTTYQKLPPNDKLLLQTGIGAGAAIVIGGLTYYFLRSKRNGSSVSSEPVANLNPSANQLPNRQLSQVPYSVPSVAKLQLDKYEKQVLGDMVAQEDLVSDFDDIGGLDEQIRTIEELVIFPLSHPHLYAHSATAQTATGVLLYGPPGTGKTLLAKAIAKTANAAFLNVNVAHIQSKWFGETPKLVEAIFTLARKAGPCVIFVDEIDGVLSARNDMDAAHVNTMKTKFMEMWDGLTTHKAAVSSSTSPDQSDWVLVIGATNKPWALDPAVLRRMPRQLYVGLPDTQARASILRVLLRKERVDPTVDLTVIAGHTEGYSGSDLKELVRAAALIPIREEIAIARMTARQKKSTEGTTNPSSVAESASSSSSSSRSPRLLSTTDLLAALEAVKPTGVAAAQYRYAQAGTANSFVIGNNNNNNNNNATVSGGSKGGKNNQPNISSSSSTSLSNPSASTASGGSSMNEKTNNNGVVTFNADVPVYMPSQSMRLNTQHLTSAVEKSAGTHAPKVVTSIVGNGQGV